METRNIAMLIPILAIICGAGVGAMAILAGYLRRRHIFSLYHQQRMAAIEKGVDLPPLPDSFLGDESRPVRTYHSRWHLFRGLFWVLGGIGLGVALGPTAGWDVSLFALIPVGIGLAHLIYYAIEGKNEAAASANVPTPPASA